LANTGETGVLLILELLQGSIVKRTIRVQDNKHVRTIGVQASQSKQ